MRMLLCITAANARARQCMLFSPDGATMLRTQQLSLSEGYCQLSGAMPAPALQTVAVQQHVKAAERLSLPRGVPGQAATPGCTRVAHHQPPLLCMVLSLQAPAPRAAEAGQSLDTCVLCTPEPCPPCKWGLGLNCMGMSERCMPCMHVQLLHEVGSWHWVHTCMHCTGGRPCLRTRIWHDLLPLD